MFYPVAYHLFFYYLLGLAVAIKGLGRQEILAHVGTERSIADR